MLIFFNYVIDWDIKIGSVVSNLFVSVFVVRVCLNWIKGFVGVIYYFGNVIFNFFENCLLLELSICLFKIVIFGVIYFWVKVIFNFFEDCLLLKLSICLFLIVIFFSFVVLIDKIFNFFFYGVSVIWKLKNKYNSLILFLNW